MARRAEEDAATWKAGAVGAEMAIGGEATTRAGQAELSSDDEKSDDEGDGSDDEVHAAVAPRHHAWPRLQYPSFCTQTVRTLSIARCRMMMAMPCGAASPSRRNRIII